MPKAKSKSDLPDIQNVTTGFPKRRIKKVGIREVRVPLKVQKKDGTMNLCSANISMYTDLSEESKGTNMSRYRILIEEFIIDKDLVLHDFVREIVKETKKRLGSDNAYIKIQFPYYLINEAPASKLKSFIDLWITFEGRHYVKNGKPVTDLYLTVRVPYTSCCPCSKEISEYGAHNQRSFADVSVKIDESKGILWIEDVYALVTRCASAPIINGLKREDEAYQTELMYENPKFVEDVVRLIACELDKELDKRVTDYVVVVNHEESIHTHNAVAVMTAGREMQ